MDNALDLHSGRLGSGPTCSTNDKSKSKSVIYYSREYMTESEDWGHVCISKIHLEFSSAVRASGVVPGRSLVRIQ